MAREGNEETVPQLRKWLADPDFVNQVGFDLGAEVQKVLAKKMTGDVFSREALVRNAELRHNEIAGPNPSPIERLLVERVVACWMYLNYLEGSYASDNKGLTIAQGIYRQKVLDRVHGRYLSAIRALADVRRLALPALQVNIAEKQVNIAGGASG
jgi:hypothetical protein